MRKLIFIIAVCMLYHNAYGAGEPCSNPCLEGTFPVPYDREACEVCPANTYMDERLCHSGMLPTCKPCPAGTGTIGDTAADHDSIDDCIPMETEEISCNPGYYLPANSQQCMQCPRNHYCPGGTFTETTSDSGITQCPDNTTSQPGSDSADDCVLNIPCNPGYYLPANSQQCTQCPKNSYCPGGTFTPTTTDSGITQCPDNMYSPLGSDSADDCGRMLHIGEYILYLRTAKLTVPSLNVQIGNTIYYGDMFPA